MLDAWDEAILRCLDEIGGAPSLERRPCSLRISSECLRCLDETLATIHRPSSSRRSRDGAGDDDLWALRSAAIEVATRSYADGVRARRRRASSHPRHESAWERRTAQAAGGAANGLEVVVCALPRDLLVEIDALARVGDRPGHPDTDGGHSIAARSVVVESAVTAWLILRGYSAVPPAPLRRGWQGALRALLGR